MAEQPNFSYLKLESTNRPTKTTTENGNLSLDEKRLKRSYQRRNVIKKAEKIEKSSDSFAMRKHHRNRTIFSNEQIAELQYYFMQSNYVNMDRAAELSLKLSLNPAPIRIWFKNQRRKIKLKQAERQLRSRGQNLPATPPYAHAAKYIQPMVAQPPTNLSPSISDVDMTFSYNSMQTDPSAYSVKQETAYQWLQHPPPMNPHHIAYNSASPHPHPHHMPRMQPFHEAVVNFNHVPYTIPSPASTSGEGNSMTVNSNNSDTSDYFSQMSPNSEIIEPQTPNSAHGEAETVFNDILDSLKTPKEEPLKTVYDKMTSAPEPLINCKFGTTSQSYQTYQSPSPCSEQSQFLEFV